jgi:CheY-like chemotaxis protein/HPt (histidine-containing phosphotransfer) domain-containing protein
MNPPEDRPELLLAMSADLRTPLHGIIGMTELLSETALTPKQQEYLSVAKASASALLSVINNLLDFSRIEAGGLGLNPIDFNLRDSLGYTMGALALRANRKGIGLVWRVSSDVPDALVGDPVILRQIAVNLIDHAVTSTRRGVVALRVSKESETESGVQLHVAVTASELGVAGSSATRPADLPAGQASPPAQQPRWVSQDPCDAAELNLATAARLIRLMDGRIWIEEDGDGGRTAHCTVRCGRRNTPVARPVPSEPTRVHGLPVLVVDPNATNRFILHEMLTRWLMKPDEADSGPSALAAMERARQAGTPFALVLLDTHLPGEDLSAGQEAGHGGGFALAERIRQDPGLAGARMIMLTSAGQRGDAARCLALGVGAYLTRPVTQQDLFDTIVTVLSAPPLNEPRPLLVTRHSLRENRRFLRLLLIEESSVNQTLAAHILERQGHLVAIARNGAEALAALEQQPFDLVLVDPQIPERDGLDLVSAIRAKEAASATRLKIVATTSHPTEADRERCLKRGLDAYLAKPFHARALVEAVGRLFPQQAEARSAAPAAPRIRGPLDRDEVVARVDGDTRLLGEIVNRFLSECPARLSEIRDAVARGDRKTLERAAHTLYDSLSNFSARDACDRALRLERLAHVGDLADAEGACAALEEGIRHLTPSLVTLGNPDA